MLGVKPRALQESGKSSIISQLHFNLSSDVFYELPFQRTLPEFTSLFLPTCLLIYLVPICVCPWGPQKTTFQIQFSPFTMCIPGIQLRLVNKLVAEYINPLSHFAGPWSNSKEARFLVHENIILYIIPKFSLRGWKEGSVVRSTGCFCRRPRFNPQIPYGELAHNCCNSFSKRSNTPWPL